MLRAILCVLALVVVAQATVPASQRQALVDFYNAADGRNWLRADNWLTGDPCVNKWIGTACDSKETTVERLEMPRNQLSGTLPASLTNLVDLNALRVDENKLHGTVPSSFATFTKMENFRLEYNSFSGAVNFIGNWPTCAYLQINNNAFSGTLPDVWKPFTELKWLDVAYNALSGSLPPTLVDAKNLEFLHLSDNHFTGLLYNATEGIYGSVFWLPQLAELYVEDNAFTGELPPALITKDNRLQYFWTDNNRLTGAIPDWVCNLFSYNLSGNNFNSCASCCKQDCDRGYIKCCGKC